MSLNHPNWKHREGNFGKSNNLVRVTHCSPPHPFSNLKGLDIKCQGQMKVLHSCPLHSNPLEDDVSNIVG